MHAGPSDFTPGALGDFRAEVVDAADEQGADGGAREGGAEGEGEVDGVEVVEAAGVFVPWSKGWGKQGKKIVNLMW